MIKNGRSLLKWALAKCESGGVRAVITQGDYGRRNPSVSHNLSYSKPARRGLKERREKEGKEKSRSSGCSRGFWFVCVLKHYFKYFNFSG
mgnify:CR=1 FL=1